VPITSDVKEVAMTTPDVTYRNVDRRERGWLRQRRKALVAVAVGASVSLVLGSLLALNSDSVTSEDNKAQSGTFAPTAHDLQAARVAQFGSCTGAAFGDGPFAAAITGTGDNINLNGGFAGQVGDFCLKNSGTQTGRLKVAFANAADVEVGACEASESGAGADTSCTDGAQGELKPLLDVGIQKRTDTSTSSSCTGAGADFLSLETSISLDADLAPGEICTVHFTIQALGSDSQKLRAQTDKLEWDIVFTLEDIPSP
jgi:hypothetical protein